MEIRKNFLDFACRWEMRLMWRAFLYRGRGNGKRLDLIGFAPLQERGSASAGGVTVELVLLLAGPGLSPPGARRLAWSVKTVGWGIGGGLEISRRWHPSVIPLVDGTWVTDGQVDDRLVWWS